MVPSFGCACLPVFIEWLFIFQTKILSKSFANELNSLLCIDLYDVNWQVVDQVSEYLFLLFDFFVCGFQLCVGRLYAVEYDDPVEQRISAGFVYVAKYIQEL